MIGFNIVKLKNINSIMARKRLMMEMAMGIDQQSIIC